MQKQHQKFKRVKSADIFSGHTKSPGKKNKEDHGCKNISKPSKTGSTWNKLPSPATDTKISRIFKTYMNVSKATPSVKKHVNSHYSSQRASLTEINQLVKTQPSQKPSKSSKMKKVSSKVEAAVEKLECKLKKVMRENKMLKNTLEGKARVTSHQRLDQALTKFKGVIESLL